MKRNMFDFLENSGEGELDMIDRLTPELSDEQFERILEMSKRKRNIIKAAKERQNINISENNDYESRVSGVEEYKRPAWTKILATAASLVLLGGGIAFAHNLLKRGGNDIPVVVPNVAATTVTATTVTTDSENADITTVTADITATGTGSAVTESETTTAEQTVTSSAAVSTAQTTEQPQETTAETTENPAYRAEAEQWVKNWFDVQLLGLVNFDWLDLSDTFDAQRLVIFLDNGDSEEEKPRELHTMTFVRYVNPRYNTVEDIKRDLVDYLYVDYVEGTYSMTEAYVKHFCGMKVVPGQLDEDNAFNKYDSYPVFTEYDGKIYMCVYDNGQLENKPSYNEMRAKFGGRWYVRNCLENSFDLIEIHENDDNLCNLFSIEKVNGKWRNTYNQPLADLYTEDEIAEIINDYEKYKCE